MKLLWLDLETSGLDPRKDHILEVAACVADLEEPFIGHSCYQAVLKMPHLGNIHPVVQEMHMKNGLWNECAKSIETLGEVEEVLIEMSGRTPASDRDNQTTLAGSCVSFDLAFLQRWMPTLAKYLHYRVYDVSSIMLFCRSLGMPRLPKVEAHRAMADVRESMTNAKACANWLANELREIPVATLQLDPEDPAVGGSVEYLLQQAEAEGPQNSGELELSERCAEYLRERLSMRSRKPTNEKCMECGHPRDDHGEDSPY